MKIRIALCASIVLASAAGAQDTVLVARPGYSVRSSRELAGDAVRMFNVATTRLYGPTEVRPGDAYQGDVGILDGPLTLDGEVQGSLIAINGDVEMTRGSRVTGDVIIVGGTLSQDPEAQILGQVHVNGRRVTVRRIGDQLELEENTPRSPRGRNDPRRYLPGGRASIVLGTEGTYNRVEGLPYHGGARVDWFGDFNGRLEALAIARTSEPFDSLFDNLGYRVNGRLGFGYDSPLEVGASVYDVVVPTESWQMSDGEIGFAAALMRRDYRDYFGKRGISAYATLALGASFSLTAEVSRDEERSVSERNPFSLVRRSQPWRPNPAIDDGRYTHIGARFGYDSRGTNRWSDMARWTLDAGWRITRSWDFQLQPLAPELRGDTPRGADSFTPGELKSGWAYLDLRRYQPIGSSGELRLRARIEGSAPPPGSGDVLPTIQERISLGGPATLPGFGFRELNCNPATAGPALCTGAMLFQVEYRGGLSFDFFDFDHDRRHRSHASQRDRSSRDDGMWFDGPQLVLFADVGLLDRPRASTPGVGAEPAAPAFRTEAVDVGAGFEFGTFGLYAARATTASAPIRFSVRLQHRF